MINWGTVPLGSVLPFHFPSYDGTTGASEAISGLAVTDIEIYKGTTVTQRSSDAGYALIDTDGIDIDGMVGANGFSVDTGDNTDAGFFVAGSFYIVWVASITADGQTVNFIAGSFRLCVAENTAGTPVIDVGRISNDATAADNAESFFDGTGYAGTGNVIPTVTTLTGHTAQTGDTFARIGAPAGASVSADVAAVKVDTAAILVDTGTTLDGKIDTIDTNVDSILDDTGTAGVVIVDGGITTAKFGAGAIDAAAVAADAVAEIADGVWDEAKSGHTTAGTFGESFNGVVSFTAQTGSTTTDIITGLTEATNDHYNGRTVVFTSGVCAGQAATITDYVGATKTLVVGAMTDAPANGDKGVIV